VSGGGQIPEMSALCTEMDSCQLPSEWTRAVSLMPPPFSKHWHLESQVQFAVSQRDVVAAPADLPALPLTKFTPPPRYMPRR